VEKYFRLIHTASSPIGTADFLTGVKRPGREGDKSPPCSEEVNNAWRYTSTARFRLQGVAFK